MKRLLILIIAVCASGVMFLEAATPSYVRYQGTLKYHGLPVDGTKTVRFRITSSDGSTQYWDSGNVTVSVSGGIFNYQLNPTTVDWTNRPAAGYFLEISVEGQVLLPREEVLANIYSLHAKDVDDNAITEAKLSPAVQTKLNAVGGGDNLGNHVATTTLHMSGYDISSAGTVYAQKVSVSSFTMTSGAVDGYFLSTDGLGNASWKSLGTLPGDNLGNHIATTTLNMSGNNITNVSTISVSAVSFGDGSVLTSSATISPSTLLGSTNTWTASQNFANVSANSITAGANINANATSIYYLGDPNTDGTWRFLISGGELTFQKRISGNYVTQSTMTDQ